MDDDDDDDDVGGALVTPDTHAASSLVSIKPRQLTNLTQVLMMLDSTAHYKTARM